MTSSNPLDLRGIAKAYGGFRLGPLDLAVPRGYVMGLVGAPDRQDPCWRGPGPAALAYRLAGP